MEPQKTHPTNELVAVCTMVASSASLATVVWEVSQADQSTGFDNLNIYIYLAAYKYFLLVFFCNAVFNVECSETIHKSDFHCV